MATMSLIGGTVTLVLYKFIKMRNNFDDKQSK